VAYGVDPDCSLVGTVVEITLLRLRGWNPFAKGAGELSPTEEERFIYENTPSTINPTSKIIPTKTMILFMS